MNYFERLIRRALLEAPARAGEALRDPFQSEAPLRLETPVQHPATPWPGRAPAQPAEISTAPVIESRIEHSSARETHTAHEPPAMPGSSIQPQAPAAPVPGEPVEVQVPETPAPLAQADAFMRSLGVTLPDLAAPVARPVAARVEAPIVKPPQRVEETPDERIAAAAAELARAQPQTMQPPFAPAPYVPRAPAAEKDAARPPATLRQAASPPERPALTPPAREIVHETIRVVKVAESQRGHASLAGAAPPTFGAGQL